MKVFRFYRILCNIFFLIYYNCSAILVFSFYRYSHDIEEVINTCILMLCRYILLITSNIKSIIKPIMSEKLPY